MFGFNRPVGAKADDREIEYVSAIHQAVMEPRRDGSITGKGIHRSQCAAFIADAIAVSTSVAIAIAM